MLLSLDPVPIVGPDAADIPKLQDNLQINYNKLQDFINQVSVPVGGITLWYGAATAVPSGWAICDGTLGTPDLRGKVPVGVDGSAEFTSLGTAGGSKTSTAPHTHGLNGHAHGGAISGGGLGTHGHTVNSHDHGGGTGIHLHGVQLQFTAVGGHNHAVGIGNAAEGPSGGGVGLSQNTTNSGVANTAQSPGTDTPNLSHSHGINGDSGASTDSSTTASSGNLQPYFALYFIMRVS